MSDEELFGLIFELRRNDRLDIESIKESNREKLEEKLKESDSKNLRDRLREIINARGPYLTTTDTDLAVDYLKCDYELVTSLGEIYINCAETEEKRNVKNNYYIQTRNLFTRAFEDVELILTIEKDLSECQMASYVKTAFVLKTKCVIIKSCIRYSLPYKQIFSLFRELTNAARNKDAPKIREYSKRLGKLIPDFSAENFILRYADASKNQNV